MTFVVSIGQDSAFIYEEMRRRKIPYDAVFLHKTRSMKDFGDFKDSKVLSFETLHLLDMLRSIYHLATSKYVIVDNYYGFLSAVHFKEGVECIQLWHAAGAIKKFGLMDRSILQRGKPARKRFINVYKKFDKVVVGSEAMAGIFIKAFNLSSENILRAGLPRTDLFFDSNRRKTVVAKLTAGQPDFRNKRTILYAPTYRDGKMDHFEMKLDLDLMYRKLGEDYILLLKLHPAVNTEINYEDQYPGFVYDYSSLKGINSLLLLTDYLITDYSSIPYEYAMLHKPMLFYPYDLKQYETERGLWGSYESLVPGPVVYTTREIVEQIVRDSFDLNKIRDFAEKWNHYSKGNSSKNVVDYLFNKAT